MTIETVKKGSSKRYTGSLSSGIESLPDSFPDGRDLPAFDSTLTSLPSQLTRASEDDTDHEDARFEADLNLAHQICAFEQAFHEVLAAYHGVDQPAMRSSFMERLDNDAIKQVKREIGTINGTDKEKDVRYLTKLLQRVTASQQEAAENVIPPQLLKQFEEHFQHALLNTDIELRTCARLEGQRNWLHRRDSPADIRDVDEAEEYGFNPALAFERTYKGRDHVMMSLGFGRSINHACIANVDWDIDDSSVSSLIEKANGGVATQIYDFHLVSGIKPSEEILAYYSDYFAENFCACPWGSQHEQTSGSSEHDTSPDYEPVNNKKKKSTKKAVKREHQHSSSDDEDRESHLIETRQSQRRKRERTASCYRQAESSTQGYREESHLCVTATSRCGDKYDETLCWVQRTSTALKEPLDATSDAATSSFSSQPLCGLMGYDTTFNSIDSTQVSDQTRSLPWGFTDADP
ncbi:uncharacterized protein I303_100988 [Kwoniella dejecticola CBS 10117]|uniref:SET domain-containing protein n=1 Tax=Kwoniella dejecticola CBS 10117 TaxID=1296121 RepID=A0AAJ8MEU3_9TREE